MIASIKIYARYITIINLFYFADIESNYQGLLKKQTLISFDVF